MATMVRMLAGAAGALWLAGTAAAADSATAAKAANATDDDRIICKKTLDTGSLVRKTKQCFTQAEWDRLAESQRTGAQKMAQDLTTKQGGN